MAVTNFIWNELTDNVMFETDENDVVTVSYTNLPERYGELLSQKRSGVTSYFHYDGDHSTRQLTDENQNVTDTFIYSAFGEEVARTGVTTNPFGYKGEVGYYTNPETNDIYVRARTYQPATGRWLSMDPLGFVDGPNLYRAYFAPMRTDPAGLTLKMIDCLRATTRARKKYKEWFDRFRALGCKVPDLICRVARACKVGDGGYFDPESKDIIICFDNYDSISDLDAVIRHELVHAFDDCMGFDWFNCRDRACSEIRAYSYSGQCEDGSPYRDGYPTREECIKAYAADSTDSDPDCAPSRRIVDELYDECVICKVCAGEPLPPTKCSIVRRPEQRRGFRSVFPSWQSNKG